VRSSCSGLVEPHSLALDECVRLLLFSRLVFVRLGDIVPLTEIIQDEISLLVNESTTAVTRLVLLMEVALGTTVPVVYRR
jgi:hypothetical protein